MIPTALALCAQVALPAQRAPDVPAPRPRVALVLSGGGARGAAHVGVLRYLEERRVPVDFVTGTSMGAIVGGLYSAGLSPAEIERVLAQTNWRTLFDDDPPREHMSWRRKIDDRSLLVDLEIGASSSGLELPSGLIQGQKIGPLFRSLTLRELATEDFDELRIPYRAVAMDLVTGETVVIDHGDLARAMRASMSIAGAFSPVEIEGRLLVDGGYVDNLPVDVAEQHGADVVIAVDVGTPPVDESGKLRSLFAINSQVRDVIIAVSRRASRARLDPDDVLIVPQLGELTFTDFERSSEAVEIGYQAAVAQADLLAGLSVDAEAWGAFLERQRAPAWQPPRVRSVAFDNRSSLATANLEAIVRLKPGDPLDAEVVRVDLELLYGLGIFESADFRVEHAEDGVDVVYVVREKRWGPNYLRFGLGLNEDFQGRSSYQVGLGVIVTPVNDLGAEWRTEGYIGSRLGVATEFYQPIDRAMRYFVAPRAVALRRSLELERGTVSSTDFTVDSLGAGLDLGRVIGTWGEARVGFEYWTGDIDARTEAPHPEEGSFRDVGYAASLRCDTLDDRDFPKEGVFGDVTGFVAREGLGSDEDFESASFALAAYETWSGVTGTVALELGTSFESDLPLQREFLLGGFGRLSGRAPDSLAGDDYALARLAGYVGLGGALLPTYGGLTFEAGDVWDHDEAVTWESPEVSAALFFGADTPIGPFIVGWGVADEGENTVFLLLGRRP